MEWNTVGIYSVRQGRLCKEEASEPLMVGRIAPKLLSNSSDFVPSISKRHHEFMSNQRRDLTEDDLYDELVTSANEKKRRLTVDQVKFLEMSFKMDIKLEPERKALIAKKLGLRPRQVAIWFQNRRARWKNKRLEQDYEALKASYDALVQENESVLKEHEAIVEENKKLQEEVLQLTSMLQSGKLPSRVDAGGGSIDLDSESDSEIALKASEQLQSKLELVSPSKSDAESEMLDTSGLCLPASEEAIVAMVDRSFGDLNSFIACTAFRFEADHWLFPSSEDIFINLPQSVNGITVDDLLLNHEDHAYGFRWHC